MRRPLRDSAGIAPLSPARRKELARRVVEGMGARAFPSRNKAWYSPKRLAERLLGTGRIERIRAWNRKRRGRQG